MSSFILLIVIGASFWELAKANKKNKWLYSILGVLSCIIGMVLGGVVVGVISFVFVDFNPAEFTAPVIFLINFLQLAFGLLACLIYYVIIKKYWNKEVRSHSDEILDEKI